MPNKYLDHSGLSYFWSKILGLVSPIDTRLTTVETNINDFECADVANEVLVINKWASIKNTTVSGEILIITNIPIDES